MSPSEQQNQEMRTKKKTETGRNFFIFFLRWSEIKLKSKLATKMGNGVIRDQHPPYDNIMVDSFPLGEGFINLICAMQRVLRTATASKKLINSHSFPLLPWLGVMNQRFTSVIRRGWNHYYLPRMVHFNKGFFEPRKHSDNFFIGNT